MNIYRIAVDAMGGDNAPEVNVAGALRALARFPDIQIQLYGDAQRISALAGEHGFGERLCVLHAPDVIDMHEHPMMAVRKKTESSLVMAVMAVKEGRAEAIVSAGSTGAVLAGGMLRIGRIEHIDRPALVTIFPGRLKPFVLLDCGANVDCQPGYLNQFAMMGAIYARTVLDVAQPQVRLLNIGAEAEKGNALSKNAYALMQAQSVYAFAGNIEARDIAEGVCDVIVADGFDGNIVVKYTEGFASTMMRMLKKQLFSSARAKLGAMLLKPALGAFKDAFNVDRYGGAPLLGVKGAVIKAHGNSNAEAIASSIGQARQMLKGDIVAEIARGVEQLAQDSPDNT